MTIVRDQGTGPAFAARPGLVIQAVYRLSKRAGEIASEFRRHARLPGFRPGKAPMSVVRQRYKDGADLIKLIRKESFFPAAAIARTSSQPHTPSPRWT